DADGVANLATVSDDDLDAVRVSSVAYGIQVVRAPRLDNGERVVRLADVGRIDGRVIAEDPRAVRGLRVYLSTPTDVADAEACLGGVAEVVTDDEGRFTVPAIAEGTLVLIYEPRRDLPFRGAFDSRPLVVVGETTQVEIPLKRAVLIKGLVRETGTGA